MNDEGELAGLPREIGKYRLDAVLGRGAMGVVYRAYDPMIERTLALKTVRAESGDAADARELLQRFRTEAKAAGRLMHPNIVAVYEYGELDDLAYIAMEFVEGKALSDLVGARPCPLPQVLGWMDDVLAALAYAHAHGVVHRDIKPANLLVTREGRVKVGDFGIARIDSSTLTRTGAMLGTPSHMSPEQLRGDPIDGRSDLFSAGVVLYQLLTGQRPFAGATAAVMQQILTHTPPPPSRLNPALPSALDAVVMCALSKAPDARFADALAFQHALSAAAVLQDSAADADATLMLPPQRTRPGTGGATGSPAGTMGTAHQAVAEEAACEPAPRDPAFVTALARLLAVEVGPIAVIIVRRAAARTTTRQELVERAAQQIEDHESRSRFLNAARSTAM